MSLRKDLTKFLWENCDYLHEFNSQDELEQAVEKHIEYRTIICSFDDKGFTGVCRFNIDGDVCEVLDVAVRPDKRNNGILQELLCKGLEVWKDVKFLEFHSVKHNRNFKIPTQLVLAKEK